MTRRARPKTSPLGPEAGAVGVRDRSWAELDSLMQPQCGPLVRTATQQSAAGKVSNPPVEGFHRRGEKEGGGRRGPPGAAGAARPPRGGGGGPRGAPPAGGG